MTDPYAIKISIVESQAANGKAVYDVKIRDLVLPAVCFLDAVHLADKIKRAINDHSCEIATIKLNTGIVAHPTR